jgi:hypothetical protein
MNKMKKLYITLALTFGLLVSFQSIQAQVKEPPDAGGSPEGNETPIGGGAPVGSGLFILLGLGAAYGGKKIYKLNKEEEM